MKRSHSRERKAGRSRWCHHRLLFVYAAGFLDKGLHFFFRKIGSAIAAKGDVKLAFAVIAAKAVKGMTIEIDKKRGAFYQVIAMIKSLAQGIEMIFLIVLAIEILTLVINKCLFFGFQGLKERDEIGIVVIEQIGFKFERQRQGCRTYERLDQAVARSRQMAGDEGDKFVFAARPFEERFTHVFSLGQSESAASSMPRSAGCALFAAHQA